MWGREVAKELNIQTKLLPVLRELGLLHPRREYQRSRAKADWYDPAQVQGLIEEELFIYCGYCDRPLIPEDAFAFVVYMYDQHPIYNRVHETCLHILKYEMRKTKATSPNFP